MLTITDSAKKQFKNLMEQNNFEAFIFGATGGGCAGFNYLLKEVSLDTLNDNDEVFEFDDVKIVMDGSSMFAVAGTEIDYVSDIMGARFEFRNPLSQSGCGCGTSFSI